MTTHAYNVIQNIFVTRMLEPTAKQVNVFNFNICTEKQFLILFLFEVAGLKFLVHRTCNLLKLALNNVKCIFYDYINAVIWKKPF
mgnify:CR=1 FL=1